MGLGIVSKKRINNPLDELDIHKITDTYDALVIDQANFILKAFDEQINNCKKIFKIFKLFNKDSITFKLPIEIFDENLTALKLKGFVPVTYINTCIGSNNNEPSIAIHDIENNEYTYKFVWRNAWY